MQALKRKIIFSCVAVALFSLSHAQLFKKKKSDGGDLIADYRQEYYHQVFGVPVYDTEYFKVYDVIADWLETPYRYGGKNEEGIDCSGFINVLFKKSFDKTIGPCAEDMYNNLEHIKRNKLREGDLVFFRIHHRKISHVGIYLGKNKFAHASASSGVIISDLEEPYYKKYFARGGRVSIH